MSLTVFGCVLMFVGFSILFFFFFFNVKVVSFYVCMQVCIVACMYVNTNISLPNFVL